MLNKKQLFTILGILISLFVVGLMAMSWFLRDSLKIFLSTQSQIYGFIITFVVSAVLEFVPQLISPHFLLVNAALVGLPSFISFIVVTLGASAGAFIAFWLGEKYGFRLAKQLYGEKKINRIKNSLHKHGKWILTLAAISPLPYIPLIFSSLGMNRKDFFIYGLVPRALSFLVVWLFLLYNINVPFV